MKKYIILILIILLISAVNSVQAENMFIEAEISEALKEAAELKEENIIFIDQPAGKVALEISTDQKFSQIAAEILAGSGYRAVPYSSYYLIGEFSHDSAEFASQSETVFYQANYLAAEVLAEKLDMDQVRVQVMKDRDQILIQGLAEDLQTARKKLAELDTISNYNQINYSLTVIDLSSELNADENLEQISFNTEQRADFEFLSSENELELLSSGLVDAIRAELENSDQKTLSIANPSLIVEAGSTGYLNLAEEILNWKEDQVETQEIDFSTELTPLNVSSRGEIKTEVEFLVNSGTDFSTTVSLTAGETELIGLLKLNENKVSSAIIRKNETKRERTYAIYLNSDFAAGGHSAELDGLDNLIFNSPEPEFKLENQYLQILFTEDYSPDLDFQFQSPGNTIFNLKSRDGFSYIELGTGFSLSDGLFLASKAQFVSQNESSFLLGIDDTVQFSKKLSLSAGLYPLVFSLSEKEFSEYAGYLNFSYLPGPLVFNLSYSHNLEAEAIRFETGLKFKNYPYLMAAVSGNSDGVENLLTGLRFQF